LDGSLSRIQADLGDASTAGDRREVKRLYLSLLTTMSRREELLGGRLPMMAAVRDRPGSG
jgi:hypothetical protein